MYKDLEGKVALITGAGDRDGIGFGIARALAREGMEIVLADLPRMDAEGCCRTLREETGCACAALPLDLTDEASIRECASRLAGRCGHVDVLVNNAGIFPRQQQAAAADDALWDTVFAVNLFGPLKLFRLLLPLLRHKSSVINMASRAGKRAAPGYAAYSASKAGLIMLTRNIAVEYAREGIRANAICPGQIMTQLARKRFARESAAGGTTPEAWLAAIVAGIPAGRMGTPDDIGGLAAFLASSASDYITGQAFNICGGQLTEL